MLQLRRESRKTGGGRREETGMKNQQHLSCWTDPSASGAAGYACSSSSAKPSGPGPLLFAQNPNSDPHREGSIYLLLLFLLPPPPLWCSWWIINIVSCTFPRTNTFLRQCSVPLLLSFCWKDLTGKMICTQPIAPQRRDDLERFYCRFLLLTPSSVRTCFGLKETKK